MKRSDSMRCIREYKRQDGSITYHAEIRRKNAKPLRASFETLIEAKNWVRKNESAILDGQRIPDNKARKYTLSNLIDQYILFKKGRSLHGLVGNTMILMKKSWKPHILNASALGSRLSFSSRN